MPIGEQHKPLDDHAPTAGEVRTELHRLLSSGAFAKAHRSRTLLHFLVERLLKATSEETNEYAIGVAVFGRIAPAYSTVDDPIVRVQVGRLREKLSSYYATEGKANPLRIGIPLGRYLPIVERTVGVPLPMLHFQQLTCLSQEQAAQFFTLGLNEEMHYRLHCLFGKQVTDNPTPSTSKRDGRLPTPAYRFEGSLRKNGEHIRIALRLVDLHTGTLVWSQLIDETFGTSITEQEHLANLCCSAMHKQWDLT